MKRFFLPAIAVIVLLTACNNNKKQVTVTSEDGKTTAKIDVAAAQDMAGALQKKQEDLQKLTPYTLDQLKAMLPETLLGVARSKFDVRTAMGASYGEARYPLNDSVTIELNIYDCAGQAGAGIYSMQYLTLMNIQSESDEEYTKSVEFKGGKGVEHLNKKSNRASFTWLAGERLLVTLEGRRTGVDVLKEAAASLNLK